MTNRLDEQSYYKLLDDINYSLDDVLKDLTVINGLDVNLPHIIRDLYNGISECKELVYDMINN